MWLGLHRTVLAYRNPVAAGLSFRIGMALSFLSSITSRMRELAYYKKESFNSTIMESCLSNCLCKSTEEHRKKREY